VITLLRGSAAALDAHCARLAAESDLALPVFPPVAARCWNGVRNLLAGVARRRGTDFVAGVLARRPAAASLVPGCFQGELSAADRAERELLAARPDSHLSHNLLIQRPMFAAWAELLHALLDNGGFTLLVSDLARLDRESLAALRAFYRRFPASAPDLVVGYDPRHDTPAPDSHGLIWESPADDVWRIALGFRALPGAVTEDLEDRGKIDPAAFAAPDEDGGPLEDGAAERAVDEMRAAFRAFGFSTVVRLGLALLRHEPRLDPERTAELHGLLGLAAHNRQFLTRGNRRLADFLEGHFRAALAAERDPVRRSCLCYRLAVVFGRRKGEPEPALAWARQAIEEAETPGLPPLRKAHLQGWAHNIEALALLRSGRPAEAEVSCERAFALLDEALAGLPAGVEPSTAPDQLVREAAFTHSLLADNLAALAKTAGDAGRLAHWKEIADRLGEHFPGLSRFESVTWIEIFRERRELRNALARAEHGLEDARAEQDALREYEYEVHSADLHDRLGEVEAAFAAFERARDLRHRLGSPRFLRPVEIPAAAAAARAGRTAEARFQFQLLLELETSDATAAQLLAAMAGLAAREGDAGEADERMNEAIGRAVESGERDALLAVAVAAGRACQVLGWDEAARDAYRRALEIAGPAGSAGEDSAPPASLLWAALLGAWETGDPDPEIPVRCLLQTGPALEDADAWWDLPRLVRALAAIAVTAPGRLADPALAESLRDLRAAAAERADCAAPLDELRAALA
jgi:tetratricopeptide (TPR) repeat protein